jgi:hypothetical protein
MIKRQLTGKTFYFTLFAKTTPFMGVLKNGIEEGGKNRKTVRNFTVIALFDIIDCLYQFYKS